MDRNLIRETVMETLELLGAETDKPAELRRDFIFLRTTRQRCEGVVNKLFITVSVSAIIFFIAALGAEYGASAFGG